jgi:methylmalonyl-CoA/ethylmalonyl-CoA epimerase
VRAQDTIALDMRVLRIRHITLGVRDLDAARASFEALFGAQAAAAVEIAAFGARMQAIALGESSVQLATPLDRDGALQRFIERRGEGVYTVALEVEDLDDAIEELAARGVRVSDPVEATPGERSSFVAMSATHGMSVQLVETAGSQRASTEPTTGAVLDEAAAASGSLPPPKRALDLTPDEWEEWSDVD